MKTLCAILCVALSGCCTVSVLPEITHVSHLTQHFGPRPTDFGYNAALLDLHIEPTKHVFIDVAEGIILDRGGTTNTGYQYAGALLGPREVFVATVGMDIPLVTR